MILSRCIIAPIRFPIYQMPYDFEMQSTRVILLRPEILQGDVFPLEQGQKVEFDTDPPVTAMLWDVGEQWVRVRDVDWDPCDAAGGVAGRPQFMTRLAQCRQSRYAIGQAQNPATFYDPLPREGMK